MQIEPHFLFNTLNAITTLVELGRQSEATEMIGHLNAILKSTLKRTTPETVPLSQELEIVENYLAIEQVRFADRPGLKSKSILERPAAWCPVFSCSRLLRTRSGTALRIAKKTDWCRQQRGAKAISCASKCAILDRWLDATLKPEAVLASRTRANA